MVILHDYLEVVERHTIPTLGRHIQGPAQNRGVTFTIATPWGSIVAS